MDTSSLDLATSQKDFDNFSGLLPLHVTFTAVQNYKRGVRRLVTKFGL
jgi:hypothetical protein